jgi:hypothetical protein
LKEIGSGGEDEQLQYAIAADDWLGPQPIAGDLEHDLATTNEGYAPVGDNHPRRQIDVGADEQHLPFPDHAVGLEGAPGSAARPANGWHVPLGTVLLFLAVQHLDFPQHPRLCHLDPASHVIAPACDLRGG